MAGVAFLKRDGVWLALGDPMGERGDRISAVWRFRDTGGGYRAVYSHGNNRMEILWTGITAAIFITVALLGRSKPVGILWAGLLFGAFKAGGFAMQASQNIPIDIVLVVQSLIVLFIAAPPLIRAIFRLPAREAS